jgi:CcmD family protein
MRNFWYLFAAYMVIWAAMFAYVAYLFAKNRELREELRVLQARVEKILAKSPSEQ